MTDLQRIELMVKTLDGKKGLDIQVFKIDELSIVADYFVLVNGTSSTHVKTLADEVEYELEKAGVKTDHIQGRATGWIVLDYDSIIVHVFDKQNRDFYKLERLWTDATSVDISGYLK
ncbi:MAG: ribosome silencing factor [Clostridia bacterium]